MHWAFVVAHEPAFVLAGRSYSSYSARPSHRSSSSPCGAQALGCTGFSSCSSWDLLLCCMWNLPEAGIEPVSPALAGRFLTTGPPGKSRRKDFENTTWADVMKNISCIFRKWQVFSCEWGMGHRKTWKAVRRKSIKFGTGSILRSILETISLSKIKLWIYTRDRNESGKKETWGKLNIKVVRLRIYDMMTH